MNPNAQYLHAINLLPQFGPARLSRLWDYFLDWNKAFNASRADLFQAGIEPEITGIFLAHREKIDLQEELQKLEAENIRLLTAEDKNYPKLLREIPKYPHLLYYKGLMDIPDELCVAVVGTRKITNYGRNVGPFLIEPLIRCGVTIVSGMALGVDSQMQRLAIKNRHRTIAVLGGGLDEASIYPKEHTLLAEQILKSGGALISEYPIGAPPLQQNFVMRNRIISGLCESTIIIECSLKSGSLITAKCALEQNRNVYAVPGDIYHEMSKGPNNLIKMGAKLITEPGDLLNDLNLKAMPAEQKAKTLNGSNQSENKILAQLSFEPTLINDIIELTGLNAADAMSTLTFMEIKGLVKNLGAQQYIRSR